MTKYFKQVPCTHDKCEHSDSTAHCVEPGPWGPKANYQCDGTALVPAPEVDAALVTLDNIRRILGGLGSEA